MNQLIEFPRNQSRQSSRLGPVGECASMLLAVTACLTAVAWMSTVPGVFSTWMISLACAWIAFRTTIIRKGSLRTAFISLCIACATLWTYWESDRTLPNWLQTGPFSALAVLAMLACIITLESANILAEPDGKVRLTITALKSRCVRAVSRYWPWGLAGLFAIYMVIIPVIGVVEDQFRDPIPSSSALEEITFLENVRLRTTEAFTAAWFFTFGATIGSYLNVIVYRTPRGESLIRKRSACPQCGTAIAGRDNVPVLGWLWLHGKCRHCQMPISSRYPIVEAFTGGMFLLLYFVELLSGGANLPVRNPNHYAGVVWIIFYTKWDLIGLYLYHCLLLVALLTWSLIRYDQQHVPWRSYVTTFALAFVPLLLWPALLLVPLGLSSISGDSSALLTAGVGMLVGFFIALPIIKSISQPRSSSKPSAETEYVVGMSLVGAMLGWQTACSVLAISLAIRLGQLVAANHIRHQLMQWSLTSCLFLATLLQLLIWRMMSIYLKSFWPILEFSVLAMTVWSIVTLTLLLLLVNQFKHRVLEPSAFTDEHSTQNNLQGIEWTR